MTMQSDTDEKPSTAGCCSPTKQETCCGPGEKSSCCDPSRTASGGCGCQ
jgi:hypothetical protein